MEQKEHIQLLEARSYGQSDKAMKIQKAYEKYYVNRSEENFAELITLLDSYCLSWVKSKLYEKGCYSDETEHTVLQDARMAVWRSISAAESMLEYFASYGHRIYQNKTSDLIKKISSERKKWGDEISIDAPINENGQTIGDILEDKDIDESTWEEKKKMYVGLFNIYCKSFMESKAFPPKNLALCYARVLPHLLHINHNLDTIPDSKGASAKWAFERMGVSRVADLKENSEKILQAEVDSTLFWCDSFNEQLENVIVNEYEEIELKDVVYTSMYDKNQIEDWADYMHKVTIKSSINTVANDKELFSLIKEYVSGKSVLYNFIEGGKSR